MTNDTRAPAKSVGAPAQDHSSRPIPQISMQRAEFVRNVYRLVLPAATRYEDLFDAERAAGIAAPIMPLLTRGDIIEVVEEAGRFFAQLFVADFVPPRNIEFVELMKVRLAGEPIDDLKGSGEFRVAWLGWHRRFGVVSPSGGVAREGIRTREEAAADVHQRSTPQRQARGTLG